MVMTNDVILREDADSVTQIMDRLSADPTNIIIIVHNDGRSPHHEHVMFGDIHGAINLPATNIKAVPQEYGHYRMNFRTGKPLRY